MKRLLQEIPFPISGVILSIVSLGNLLQDITEYSHVICGVIAVIGFVLVTLKIIVCWEEQKRALKDPVLTSTLPTYSMTIIMLSTYLKPMIGEAALILWVIGIVLHLIIVCYFTYEFIAVHLEWHKIFATYFIGYAGIATIAITAPVYYLEKLGQTAFWVGFISAGIMMAIVTYRNIKYPHKEPQERPLLCVYASPLNVCLIGYLHSFSKVNVKMVMGIYIVACILYMVALTNVKQSISRTFYTSYASYTFPFVVAASGTKQVILRLSEMGYMNILHLHIWLVIQVVMALILVSYTGGRYLIYIYGKLRKNEENL